jgi:hypothetical protein
MLCAGCAEDYNHCAVCGKSYGDDRISTCCCNGLANSYCSDCISTIDGAGVCEGTGFYSHYYCAECVVIVGEHKRCEDCDNRSWWTGGSDEEEE